MFTINLEDGREAPSRAKKKGAKRLEFLVNVKPLANKVFKNYKIKREKYVILDQSKIERVHLNQVVASWKVI